MAIPSVLSIAGSDSCGGAGLQADVKTATALGVYAQTAVTALTAQNTFGVQGIFSVPPSFVEEQIDAVFADMRPDGVKVGMVGSPEVVCAIAQRLSAHDAKNVVVDPVLVATAGDALATDGVADALVRHLFPLASVITPNIPEAQVLTGQTIASKEDMVRCAQRLAELTAGAVLLKGGHLTGSADDLLVDAAGRQWWFTGQLYDTPNTHGTGCTLSTAVACGLAAGKDLPDAVAAAKDYVAGAIAHNPNMGQGVTGPLNHMWMQG